MKDLNSIISNYRFYSNKEELNRDLAPIRKLKFLKEVSKGSKHIFVAALILCMLLYAVLLFMAVLDGIEGSVYVILVKIIGLTGIFFGVLGFGIGLYCNFKELSFFRDNFSNVRLEDASYLIDDDFNLFVSTDDYDLLNTYNEISALNKDFSELIKKIINNRDGDFYIIDVIMLWGDDIEYSFNFYKSILKENKNKEQALNKLKEI